MKTALFVNFTEEEFIGYWDGKGKKFVPGASLYMPDYLARHFAKHLVNRELLRKDRAGNLIYKDGEKFTSPKKPEEVPIFMELFGKAYIPDTDDELAQPKDDIDALINSANKNRTKESGEGKPSKGGIQDPSQPQIVVSPDFDEEGEEAGKEE